MLDRMVYGRFGYGNEFTRLKMSVIWILQAKELEKVIQITSERRPAHALTGRFLSLEGDQKCCLQSHTPSAAMPVKHSQACEKSPAFVYLQAAPG